MANDQGTVLGYRNYIEDADTTITTSTTVVGDRVVANVATTYSDDAWRVGGLSADATSAQVTIVFSTARAIEALTAQFPRGVYPGVSESAPNFASTDTIRARLYDASDALLLDTTAEASGVVVGYGMYLKELGQAYTTKKIVIDFNAISRASATFFDVGHIGAWPLVAPSVGAAYPMGFGWTLNTENQRTIAGRIYTARFEPMRRWSLAFDFLTQAESLIVDEMIRYSGGARQVLVKRGDLPSGKNAMLALVTPSRDLEYRTAERLQVPLTFEEFI